MLPRYKCSGKSQVHCNSITILFCDNIFRELNFAQLFSVLEKVLAFIRLVFLPLSMSFISKFLIENINKCQSAVHFVLGELSFHLPDLER